MSAHGSGTDPREPRRAQEPPSWPGEPMSWSTFLAARDAARGWALEAGRRLLDGEAAGALPGWRMEPRLAVALARRLARELPAPGPEALAATLAPTQDLPRLSRGPAEPFLHREALERAELPVVADTPLHRCAFGLERLAFLAARVEDRERGAWSRASYAADPTRDAEAAGLWAGWLSGNPWSLRRPWERLFLPEAARVFRAVAADRKLSPEVSRRALEDLREAFFYRMIGGKGALPGWAELAARVIETGPPGPLDALLGALPAGDRARLAACAATRGVWRGSAAAVWRAPGEEARAALGAAALAARPAEAEGWLDAHLVRRLLVAWRSGRTSTDWILATQNRGRARARARALLAARGAKLAEPLLALDALYARTAAALRRLAWGWAWSELARDFSFDLGRPLTTPCRPPAAPRPSPLSPEERPALRSWVLLVALKGRLGHLRAWVAEGRTGDRDSTWGRLLSEDLPALLREGAEDLHYRRLRAALSAELGACLEALRSPLAAVVALPPGRRLRAAFEEALRPGWDERVPFPRSGFPTFQQHAAEALDALEGA